MKKLLTLLLCMSAHVIHAQDASFLLKFKDEVTPHKVTAVFVLPGEKIKIEPLFERPDDRFKIKGENGKINELREHVWEWEAPKEKGIYEVVISEINDRDSVKLNCIVMVPFEELKGEYLNGYRIGKYPKSTNDLYTLPKGFIEVTKENEKTQVSPHYVLKDFLCKQQGDYPKYVVLKERGILKLEMVQNYLKSQDLPMKKFSFISGFRTPYYNKSIGNVVFSRHVFGDAFDVYIDGDGNSRMDDLNKDGKEDGLDVTYLYQLINKMYAQPWYKPFIGGLGLYKPNSRRTGFIHMDSRGIRARWG